jgi:hypothetical protein
MYEYWFVKKLRFQYIPKVAKTAAGTVHLAPEWDPLDMTPGGSDIVRQMAASYGYKSTPVSEKVEVMMDNFKLPSGEWVKPCLFTGPLAETRLSSYGKLFAYCDGVDSGTDIVGQVVMNYEIEFCLPQKSVPGDAKTTYSGNANEFKIASSNTVPQALRGLIKEWDGTDPTNGIYANENGVGKVSLPISAIFEGVLGTPTGSATLHDQAGRLIEAGTKVFWKQTPNIYNTTTNAPTKSVNQYTVGNISTDPSFAEPYDLLFNGASGDTFPLFDISYTSLV